MTRSKLNRIPLLTFLLFQYIFMAKAIIGGFRKTNFLSIDTYKFNASVHSDGPCKVSVISCVNDCQLDDSCRSVSCNMKTQICWKHRIDPQVQLDQLQRDRHWRIFYHLTGKLRPKVINYLAPDLIHYGENVTVRCVVVGNPVPDVEVYYRIYSNNTISRKKGLVITDYGRQNDGDYKCHAINNLGVDDCEFKLQGQA